VLVGDEVLDVALEDPATDVHSAGGMVDGELAILPHVHQMELVAPVQARFDVLGRALLDAFLGVGDHRQKAGVVLHRRKPTR
jgi:hypothetical protein